MISGCFVPNRYVDMPVRRHIQDEGSPRLLAGLMKEASMSFVGSIQSIDRSLHSDNVPQGKKKLKEKVNFLFDIRHTNWQCNFPKFSDRSVVGMTK